MITVKVDGNKVMIPSFEEMTLRQYSDVMANIKEFDIAKYLSIVCNVDYHKAINFEISNYPALKMMLGKLCVIKAEQPAIAGINYIEDLKVGHIFEYDGTLYDFENMKLDKVGHRMLFEQGIETMTNYIDLYTFALAIALGDFDYESTIKSTKKLQSYNAYQVLKHGSSFFLRWNIGVNKGTLIFGRQMTGFRTAMKLLKFRLVLRNLVSTILFLRLRKYAKPLTQQ